MNIRLGGGGRWGKWEAFYMWEKKKLAEGYKIDFSRY